MGLLCSRSEKIENIYLGRCVVVRWPFDSKSVLFVQSECICHFVSGYYSACNN